MYEGCLGFSWWRKLDQKLSTAIIQGELRRFFDFYWNLGKVEEHFPFSVQTSDHFIVTSWIHEAYHLLNLFNTPLQLHYRNMKVNNLSKSRSLALFSFQNCGGAFFQRFLPLYFCKFAFLCLKESTCEKRKNIFTSRRKRLWDNQILTFQIFKCCDVIKCPNMKHQTNFTE